MPRTGLCPTQQRRIVAYLDGMLDKAEAIRAAQADCVASGRNSTR